MNQPNLLIYGATGYTGELIARRAVQTGMHPILAGRNAAKIAALAPELDVESRVFSLDDASALDAGLRDIGMVLHCAGPFSQTAKPMADACIRHRAHYLDITGEIAVYESLARKSKAAFDAGVMLMPGVGFDVVPSDCLAAHLKRRMPNAKQLTLAWMSTGGSSRGTLRTAAQGIHLGGAVR
ncbi:MAG: saccharopine dehydrogenase NADP-binding domain-containing protein, partial [Chloroflexi bacterium]|nr:saccharopine dehydrogenase NADP-binding domain-containing protein [Chloroflexota bacterium]